MVLNLNKKIEKGGFIMKFSMSKENYINYLNFLCEKGKIEKDILNEIDEIVTRILKKEYDNITINNFIKKDVFDFIRKKIYRIYKTNVSSKLLLDTLNIYNLYNELILRISQNYEKNKFKCFSLGIEEPIYNFTRLFYEKIRLFKYKDIIKNHTSERALFPNKFKDKDIEHNFDTTEDHYNAPQLTIVYIINEFMKEGVYYDFISFLKLFLEYTQVNVVTKTENSWLSLKYEKWNKLSDKTKLNLYENNNIYLIDKTSKNNKFYGTMNFQKFLLGSIKNRKETWIPFFKNKNKYLSIFNNDKVVVDKKYIENVKKEVINQLNNHSK